MNPLRDGKKKQRRLHASYNQSRDHETVQIDLYFSLWKFPLTGASKAFYDDWWWWWYWSSEVCEWLISCSWADFALQPGYSRWCHRQKANKLQSHPSFIIENGRRFIGDRSEQWVSNPDRISAKKISAPSVSVSVFRGGKKGVLLSRGPTCVSGIIACVFRSPFFSGGFRKFSGVWNIFDQFLRITILCCSLTKLEAPSPYFVANVGKWHRLIMMSFVSSNTK